MEFLQQTFTVLSAEWNSSALSLLHKVSLMGLLASLSMWALEHSSVVRFARNCFAATRQALLKNS